MAAVSAYNLDLMAVCVAADGVAPDTSCSAAYEVFASDEALPGLAIVESSGAPIGIVHRQSFMLALAGADGRSTYGARPISCLMDADPLTVERRTDLTALSDTVLQDMAGPPTASFIVMDAGRYAGVGSVAALLRLLTARLLLQAEEAEAAKNEAEAAAESKGRFLANMTHELRTPLNGVIGFGELLEAETHGPLGAQEYKLYAKDIVDSGRHLVAIINDILDLAKIEAGRVDLNERFIDLRELTGRALRMVETLAARKQINLHADSAMRHWSVRADERRLQQAIINLLSNAIKFTPTGGNVGIDVGLSARWIWIEVWDGGCGIADSDLQRLFKPFEQVVGAPGSAQEGTGLGLAITRALMRSHGGDVDLASTVGEGTRVKLMLPRSRLLAEAFTWSAQSKVEFIDLPDDDFEAEAVG